MLFSPAYLSALIVEPLRFFYASYAGPDLVWTSDPKTSTIEIDTINNFNKIAIQAKPRILISRGAATIKSTGLSDNLAEGPSNRDLGAGKEIRFLLAHGQAQVLIEARNEGTCEKVLELTENFLAWSAPMIASTQGFKNFALPLSVSPCTPSRDDVEIFQCSLSVPWSKETQYQITTDGLNLKGFLTSLVSGPVTQEIIL